MKEKRSEDRNFYPQTYKTKKIKSSNVLQLNITCIIVWDCNCKKHDCIDSCKYIFVTMFILQTSKKSIKYVTIVL